MINNKTTDITYQKLHSLVETSKILNSKQDTDTILKILLERCFELVPGGDIGVIFLYNPISQLLEMKAFTGMGDSVKDVKLKPGESMTGIAFNKKESIFFKNTNTVMNAMNTMEAHNKALTHMANLDSSNVKSSICCPLIHKDIPIGVLVIDNIEESTPLLEEDVEFLEAISIQATIAIVNAQNYEKEIEANRSLKLYTEIIEKERNNYRFSMDLHTNFTDMVLDGSTINDILLESKKILKLDLFIIDELYNMNFKTFNENSYANSISNEFYEMIRYLKSNKNISYRSSSIEKYIHIFPIMVTAESLGWLCVLSDKEYLDELENITTEKASTVIALEFLKTKDLFNMEQSLKGDFIENLLQNTSQDYIAKCCRLYNLKQMGNYRVILFRFNFNISSSYDDKKEINAIKFINKFYSTINEHLKYHFNHTFSVIKGTNIVAIIDTTTINNKTPIDTFMNTLDNKLSTLSKQMDENYEFKAAISDSFKNIIDFTQYYNNAEYVLKIISKYEKHSKYMYYDNLEIIKFLSNNNTDDLQSFVNKVLGPIIAYKSSSQKEFMNTLETYIRSNCSWSHTKESLHIHGNTLNYRINKISEILNLNLNNYQDRLKIQIAFEIIELIN